MNPEALDPVRLLRPRRRIEGVSAILLPFCANGEIDWTALAAGIRRTAAAGAGEANSDAGFEIEQFQSPEDC